MAQAVPQRDRYNKTSKYRIPALNGTQTTELKQLRKEAVQLYSTSRATLLALSQCQFGQKTVLSTMPGR